MKCPINSFISVHQEDPYKLVLLAKDTKRVCVTNADFFFTNGELSFVTGDEEGIIRIYEYNPQGILTLFLSPRWMCEMIICL